MLVRIYTMSENAPNAVIVYRVAQAQIQIPPGPYLMKLFLWTIG